MAETSKVRDFAFYNSTGFKVPPFACLGITSTTNESGEITYQVRRPTYADEQAQDPARLVFNLGDYVQVNSWGRCTSSFPVQAITAASNPGDIVGPVKDSFVLQKTGNAFIAKVLDGTMPHTESGADTWIVEPNIAEVAIVRITSNTRDANGFYPGVVETYDSATNTWVTVRTCKVKDVNL